MEADPQTSAASADALRDNTKASGAAASEGAPDRAASGRTRSEGQWGKRNTAGVVIASSIRFESVSHSYGPRHTLKSVDLSVNPGEVMCLLGPSGSGKTTLLRLAAGLVRPTSGRVLIDQREVAGPGTFIEPERRGVGLVFQDFALFPHLTIARNVEFGMTRLSRSERREYALRLLARVGLEHAADLYPHNLSGGEQQRVALARALAPRPGILLMDEPFSGLDARLRETVREQTLSLLRDTRSTVIVVTHDPEEALSIGDRIALMRDGRIVQAGDGETLYHHPSDLFCARFFSELNIFEARRIGGRVETPFGIMPESGLANVPGEDTGDEYRLCVRPTDFEITPLPPADAPHGRRKGDQGPAAHGMTAAAGLPPMVRGWIRHRRFAGEVEMVEVAIEGRDEPVLVRLRQGMLAAGERHVLIGPKPGTPMLFADSR